MKLAVLISFSGEGGVERMVMNLVREFAERCDSLDLLVIRARGPHFADIPANVRVTKLAAEHTLTAIPELVRYFKTAKPDSMLVAKDRAGRAALIARRLAGVSTRIVVRLGTNLSTALAHRSVLSRWWRKAPMRRLYRKVDKIIAVSEGVARDTLAITGLPQEKVVVVRNPVITDTLLQQAEVSPPHPWLHSKDLPIILGVGRLSEQKDFAALIHAFALVNDRHPSRLIIIGEGGKRESLEMLITSLELEDRVLLPGFQTNPAAWLKNADVFVLSSRWEGSPNALTEALALGVPSLSTRCPSGPDETLSQGEYGPLVDIGDINAMADGIQSLLENPPPEVKLKEAVREYHASVSAAKYLDILRG